jgi:hypothetical protein
MPDDLTQIENARNFAEALTGWLEKRVPSGYYGYVEIPIEDGRVSDVKITRRIRPRRPKAK